MKCNIELLKTKWIASQRQLTELELVDTSIMVLKGIPPCLTPDLLHILASMVISCLKKMPVKVKIYGGSNIFFVFFCNTPSCPIKACYECLTPPGSRWPDCSCRHKLPLSINMRRGCWWATPGKDLMQPKKERQNCYNPTYASGARWRSFYPSFAWGDSPALAFGHICLCSGLSQVLRKLGCEICGDVLCTGDANGPCKQGQELGYGWPSCLGNLSESTWCLRGKEGKF